MIMGLILLDMDGTVRRAKSGATFINDPADQELIPGVIETMQHLRSKGHRMIGVTNQGGVKAGFKSLADCIREQRYTIELCKGLLDAIVFCPDDGDSAWIVWAHGEVSGSAGISYHGNDWIPDLKTIERLRQNFEQQLEIKDFNYPFRFQGVTTPYASGYYRKPHGGMALLAQLYYCEVLINDPVHQTVDPTPIRGPFPIQPPLAEKHKPLMMVGDMDSDGDMAAALGIPYRNAKTWLYKRLPED